MLPQGWGEGAGQEGVGSGRGQDRSAKCSFVKCSSVYVNPSKHSTWHVPLVLLVVLEQLLSSLPPKILQFLGQKYSSSNSPKNKDFPDFS